MDSEKYRKIIVAGCMAVVLAIGIAVFVYTRPAAPAVAQQPAAPPPPAEPAPPPPPPVAQGSDSTSPPAPADSVASTDKAAPPSLAKSKPALTQSRNKPVTPSVAADAGAKRASAPAGSGDLASTAVASTSSDSNVDKASEATASGDSDSAATDRQITSDVKSQISRDDSSQGAAIEVSTDHGVVALKGSVPDQNTFDHVKELVASVRGVMGVDTSGLSIAS